jgi:hypothetical protein
MSDNADEMQKILEQRSLKKYIPSKRNAKRVGLVLLVLLILGYIGLHIWLDIWFAGQIKWDHRKQDIDFQQTFLKTTIDFPDEWLQEPSVVYSPDQYKDLNQSWEAFNKENNSFASKFNKWEELLNSPGGITKSEWQELGGDLQKAEQFLLAGSKLSLELEDQVASLKLDERFKILPSNNWSCYSYSLFARLNAAYLVYTNKVEDGVDLLISTLPFSIYDPVFDFDSYQSRKWYMQQTISSAHSRVRFLNSKQHLRDWLDKLNKLHPFLFRRDYEKAPIYSLLSKMKMEIKNGHKLDMTSGQIGEFYIRQLADLRFPESGWEGMKKGMDKILQVYLSGQQIRGYREDATMVMYLFRSITFSSKLDQYRLLSSVYLTNPTENMQNEQNSESQFNELRLTIAGRLYFLENNEYPKSTAQLIPKYIPGEVKDVSTGRSYTWDKNGNLKTTK